MSAAHLNQISVDERDPDREFRVEVQLLGEEKVDDPEEGRADTEYRAQLGPFV